MIDQTKVRITFPGLDDAAAGQRAQELLHELRQDATLVAHLDRKQTAVARTDPEGQDFGVTLIAVLGTPAVIILAKAIRNWMERTGTEVEANGIVLKNVRSQDAAAIVAASRKGAGADGERPSKTKSNDASPAKGAAGGKARSASGPSRPDPVATPSSKKATDKAADAQGKQSGKERQAKPRA